MKHINQKHCNTCGQTCVAMIADVSYEESVAAFGKKSCTSAKDLIGALRKFGISCADGLTRIKKQPKTDFCIVLLHFGKEKYTHWVVYKDGLYYDPAESIGIGYREPVYETSFLPIYEAVSADA